MTVGKALLWAGGIAAGAFVVYELTKSSSTPKASSTASLVTSTGTLVEGLVTGIGSLFKSPSGPNAIGPNANGGQGYYIAGSNGAAYGSTGAAANYSYADANPGTALPPGVYGPPVPSDSNGLAAPTVPSDFDTSNYSTSGGFMYTDTDGTFVAG